MTCVGCSTLQTAHAHVHTSMPNTADAHDGIALMCDGYCKVMSASRVMRMHMCHMHVDRSFIVSTSPRTPISPTHIISPPFATSPRFTATHTGSDAHMPSDACADVRRGDAGVTAHTQQHVHVSTWKSPRGRAAIQEWGETRRGP